VSSSDYGIFVLILSRHTKWFQLLQEAELCLTSYLAFIKLLLLPLFYCQSEPFNFWRFELLLDFPHLWPALEGLSKCEHIHFIHSVVIPHLHELDFLQFCLHSLVTTFLVESDDPRIDSTALFYEQTVLLFSVSNLSVSFVLSMPYFEPSETIT